MRRGQFRTRGSGARALATGTVSRATVAIMFALQPVLPARVPVPFLTEARARLPRSARQQVLRAPVHRRFARVLLEPLAGPITVPASLAAVAVALAALRLVLVPAGLAVRVSTRQRTGKLRTARVALDFARNRETKPTSASALTLLGLKVRGALFRAPLFLPAYES